MVLLAKTTGIHESNLFFNTAIIAVVYFGLLHVTASSIVDYKPRSYYRFEDPSNLMKDSAPAALHLVPQGSAIPTAMKQDDGGQVGGWMLLNGCDKNWNKTLLGRACIATLQYII